MERAASLSELLGLSTENGEGGECFLAVVGLEGVSIIRSMVSSESLRKLVLGVSIGDDSPRATWA